MCYFRHVASTYVQVVLWGRCPDLSSEPGTPPAGERLVLVPAFLDPVGSGSLPPGVEHYGAPEIRGAPAEEIEPAVDRLLGPLLRHPAFNHALPPAGGKSSRGPHAVEPAGPHSAKIS
jgi:hypothetical protein